MAKLLSAVVRRPGRTSSVLLAASGVGIALRPRQAAAALGLSTGTSRGLTETRAGLGGTYAALGLWALARGTADAYSAVGATWLGAGLLRLLSLRLDEPETDWTFWAYLSAELGLGLSGLLARARKD